MADFSIQFQKDSDIILYLEKFRQNIKKTPFFDVKLFIEDNFAFFHIRPLIFPIYWLSPIIWCIGIFMFGFNLKLLIFGAIPGLTYLLYIRPWYVLMFYIGKWKGKYKGWIKLL